MVLLVLVVQTDRTASMACRVRTAPTVKTPMVWSLSGHRLVDQRHRRQAIAGATITLHHHGVTRRQNLTDALHTMWLCTRHIEGAPAFNSSVSDNWTSPRRVGRLGQDGADATRSVAGVFFFDRSYTHDGVGAGSFWSNAAAEAATPGTTLTGDHVTQYNNGTPWIDSRRWSGSSWSLPDNLFDGDMVVNGTLSVEALIALDFDLLGDARISGTLTADHIDSDVINIVLLDSGSSSLLTTSTSQRTLSQPYADFDALMVECSGNSAADTWGVVVLSVAGLQSHIGTYRRYGCVIGPETVDCQVRLSSGFSTTIHFRRETAISNVMAVRRIWGLKT